MTTDLVHKDPSTFINTANALNGTAISFDIFDPADPYECAWALTELTMLDPETPKRLDADVRRYIGEVCKESGLVKVPEILASVADFGDEDYFELSAINVERMEDAQVFLANQAARKEEIETYVSDKLRSMIHELNILPLQNRRQDAGSMRVWSRRCLHSICILAPNSYRTLLVLSRISYSLFPISQNRPCRHSWIMTSRISSSHPLSWC